jgi:hypothetical protein
MMVPVGRGSNRVSVGSHALRDVYACRRRATGCRLGVSRSPGRFARVHGGDHRGWIIVEVENRVEARNTLPPAYRAQGRILGLNKFSLEEIDALLKQHGG